MGTDLRLLWRRRPLALAVLALALLTVCSEVSPVVGADAKPAGSFQISAWTFDRGNAKVFANPDIYADYRDKFPELVAGGIFGRFDLSFDAAKIAFCYTQEGGQYRIYEIDIDPKTGMRVPGKGVRQLTFGGQREEETMRRFKGGDAGRGCDDMDPCYMPNGKIMFSSTRAHRCVLCAPQTATTMHVMDGGGKN